MELGTESLAGNWELCWELGAMVGTGSFAWNFNFTFRMLRQQKQDLEAIDEDEGYFRRMLRSPRGLAIKRPAHFHFGRLVKKSLIKPKQMGLQRICRPKAPLRNLIDQFHMRVSKRKSMRDFELECDYQVAPSKSHRARDSYYLRPI